MTTTKSQKIFFSLLILLLMWNNSSLSMELIHKDLKPKPLLEPPANFHTQANHSFGRFNDYSKNTALLDESLINAPQIAHEIIAQLSDPTFDKSTLRQIALVGPTGCGKSVLARAIAYRLKRDYLYLAATDLLSSYRGGTEKNIRGLFQQLNQYKPMPILILDEMWVIGGGNKPQHCDQLEALGALCTLLDTQSQVDNFLMIGTTCNPENIAGDLRRRCRVTPIPQISVTPQIIVAAINKHSNYSLAEECNQEYLEELAQKAKIFSIRGIAGMIDYAVMNAWDKGTKTITKELLDAACEKMLYNRRKFTSLPME